MKDESRNRFLGRGAELLLWTVAIMCFVVIAWGRLLRAQADQASLRLITPAAGVTQASQPVVTNRSNAEDDVIGRLTIPKLGVSVPITAGVGTTSLLRGVGHIDGTAFPGGLGTVALAGHRDTYLRSLEKVAKSMEFLVTTKVGTYHYEVESWEIVTPDRVDVLSIRDEPELVLITCYPFHYIGAAPKRFVVHARLVSLAADALPIPTAGNNAPK